MKLIMRIITGIPILQTHRIAKSYLNSSTLPRPSSLESPVLGERKYRDEVKLRLNRQGMALREGSAPCVPVHVFWGRHRRGSAHMSILTFGVARNCRSCTVVQLSIAQSGSELVQLNEDAFGMPSIQGVAEGAKGEGREVQGLKTIKSS